MGRIEAEISRRNASLMSAKSVDGIEEVDAVMPFCTGEIYEDGKLSLELGITQGEHVKGASEIPAFFMAVPPPLGIGVRVMAQAGLVIFGFRGFVRALRLSAMGIGVNGYSGAIAGKGKPVLWDDAIFNRRKDSGEIKNVLEDALGVVLGERLPMKNTIYQFFSGVFLRFRLGQLAIRANVRFRFFTIFAGGKEKGTGITFTIAFPKAVHKVIIRSKGREFVRGGTANECNEHDLGRKDVAHPKRKAEPGIGAVEKEREADEGTQNLSLVLSGPTILVIVV